MVELVGMLLMLVVALAFVPVFKWLGRHYDKVEKDKALAAASASQASRRDSNTRDFRIN